MQEANAKAKCPLRRFVFPKHNCNLEIYIRAVFHFVLIIHTQSDQKQIYKTMSASSTQMILVTVSPSRMALWHSREESLMEKRNRACAALRESWKDRKSLDVGLYVCNGTREAEYIVQQIEVLGGREGPSSPSGASDSSTKVGRNKNKQKSSSSSVIPTIGGVLKATLPYTEEFATQFELQAHVLGADLDIGKVMSKRSNGNGIFFETWAKLHVLPFEDTFAYNYDHMFHKQVVPFLRKSPVSFLGLHHDFAANGGRFRVEGVQLDRTGATEVDKNAPANSEAEKNTLAIAGHHTSVFYEGPKLRRDLLEYIHVQPYEAGLDAEFYDTTKAKNKYLEKAAEKNKNLSNLGREVDEKKLMDQLLRAYFQQRSSPLRVGESFLPAHRVWIDRGRGFYKNMRSENEDGESSKSPTSIRGGTSPAAAKNNKGSSVLESANQLITRSTDPPIIWFKVISTKGGAQGVGCIGPNTEIRCRGTAVRGDPPQILDEEFKRAMQLGGGGNGGASSSEPDKCVVM
ncbi:unnamed protein product [Amoebophrya sp. A25]|nr:unnamed protein product [Amoebophrya sp. A25]|eukprot:GSA25T00019992001.1